MRALGIAVVAAAGTSPIATLAQTRPAAARACLAASGLAIARISGRAASFDDRTGYDALLIGGRSRQRWLHGRLTARLCLYERRTGRAVVTDAPGWPVPLR